MSIGPAVVTAPLTQAPALQTPASLPADRGGTPSQAEFSSMLDSAATNPTLRLTPEVKVPAQGAVTPHNRLGDQVLSGLHKLGKSVEAMSKLGTAPRDTKMPSAAKPASSAGPAQNSPATQSFDSNLHDMQAMWEGGMQQQKQLYQTVFEYELVQESAQSMMKSLKSLLTQGGG